jgi:hypothetical protein
MLDYARYTSRSQDTAYFPGEVMPGVRRDVVEDATGKSQVEDTFTIGQCGGRADAVGDTRIAQARAADRFFRDVAAVQAEERYAALKGLRAGRRLGSIRVHQPWAYRLSPSVVAIGP